MEASRTTALAALSTRPIPGTADSVAPASHLFLRYGALHPRFEAPLELPVRRDLVARFPQVDGEAGEIGGAERRGLQHFRPHHRDAEQVGLELHQRSEEHTSELQSPCNLVCRLLLEKKK